LRCRRTVEQPWPGIWSSARWRGERALVRLAVYLDYVHRRDAGGVYAPRAFALFVAGLREQFERVTVIGRVDPEPGRSHYRISDGIGFVEMPHYASAVDALGLASALPLALRCWETVLRDVDVVWVLGPQGLALPLALLALVRGKRVVLGVRQDLPAYARSRHPHRRAVHAAAHVLDGAFRGLGHLVPAIVVGPELAARYAGGRPVLPLTVSLVSEQEIDASPPERRWDGEFTVISVGRLEEEKNPLLLADVLARLRATDPRWRLVVCGEGPLEGPLRERLAAFGVADAADLRGYLPLDGGLREAYREAHAFLHVSHTEGLPQVLFEAFAARLPVVATAVGSVPAAGGDAVLLVQPGDADTAAVRLRELAADQGLRKRLLAAGLARVRAHSMEAELRRTAAFLKDERDGSALAPLQCVAGTRRLSDPRLRIFTRSVCSSPLRNRRQ
jgi:glycosyltransferase involved in cell wall biosynthesis